MIRDAINAGDIPGPRYLANGQEMARTGGELVGPMTAFADGPDQMRKVIREHVDIGVDNIKLSMSGEEVSVAVIASSTFPRPVACEGSHWYRLRRLDLHRTAISQMKKQLRAYTRRIN